MYVVNVQKLLRVHITLLDMNKHTLDKHFMKVSYVVSQVFCIRGLRQVRNMNAVNTGKPFMRNQPPLNIRKCIQKRKLMSATSVEKA